MKRLYTLDYSASLLSVFDIGGSLFLDHNVLQSKGLAHDMHELMKDQNILQKDYENACKKITKNEEK